jgi:hypothetical protein
MASPGLNLDPAQQPSIQNVVEQRLRAEGIVKRGAGWFLTIALLSMVNSILNLSSARIHFIFGLGIAQVVDGIASRLGSNGAVLDLVINGFVAGIFVLFWKFARKGESWAFWLGMSLYAVDGVIVLLFQDYLGAAFHAYALYRIYSGLSGISTLRQAQAASLHTGGAIEPH